MSVPVRSSLHLVKRKAGKQKQSSGDQQNFAELRKLYHNLQKEHEQVGMAFQNLKVKNKELVRDLAERDAAMEELANLMSTKDEAIKNMERRLPAANISATVRGTDRARQLSQSFQYSQAVPEGPSGNF